MVTLAVAILKSNLAIISKHKHAHYKKNSTLPGSSTCVCSYEKFSSRLGEIPANEVPSPLGELPYFSHEHKEGEISLTCASPPNRASSLPYEQILVIAL